MAPDHDAATSAPVSALQYELDQCRKELAFTREQLVKAWIGGRAPIEDPPEENGVNPMDFVSVEGGVGDEEVSEDP